MNVLITGGSGRLGKEFKKVYPTAYFPTHQEMDIINSVQVTEVISNYSPDVIIHLAGLTGIPACEKDKERAWKVNYLGTKKLVEVTRNLKNVLFVYMSTSCVFSGEEGNYDEESIPHPKNFYGLTKLLGEVAVQSSGLKRWLIIRGNFISRAPYPYPRAFTDRYGTYMFADDLAFGIKETIREGYTGIVHVVGDKKVSMYQLAKIVSPNVEPMTLKDYSGPPLTKDMSLVSKRILAFSVLPRVDLPGWVEDGL